MALRCDVCSGCGKCFGTYEHRMQVLTQGFFPTLPRDNYIVATDIGTTTIAMVLLDDRGNVLSEEKVLNPQGIYGADVLSRITAARNEAVRTEMGQAVMQVLERGILRFTEELGKAPNLQMIAANTTEVYLLLGLSPQELGVAPFHASHLQEQRLTIAGVDTWILPGMSAFVGADLYAGMLATGLQESSRYKLLIDLGTNGEMLLGNREHIYACATAAGPAFEGGPNKGIWGADMVSLLAQLKTRGLVDDTGLLSDPYFDRGIRIGDVLITQESIRALQLAKAAIAAGIQILIDEAGLQTSDIAEVILAGGLGCALCAEDAVVIGLLPEDLLPVAVAGGNTALQGAALAGSSILKNRTWIQELPQVTVLNLAKHPSFEGIYYESMNLVPWKMGDSLYGEE